MSGPISAIRPHHTFFPFNTNAIAVHPTIATPAMRNVSLYAISNASRITRWFRSASASSCTPPVDAPGNASARGTCTRDSSRASIAMRS